jgi:hypothetical protein
LGWVIVGVALRLLISACKKDELKTLVDKVNFFGDVTAGAKEPFAQINRSGVSKEEEEA